MAEIKKIVKRRNSAKNIKKITETMALIATTKFQAAAKRVKGIQPYAQRLNNLLQSLAANHEHVHHPLLERNDDQNRIAILLITSTRGFCGSYNTNMIQFCRQTLSELKDQGFEVELHIAGKKGYDFFSNYKMQDIEIHHYPEIGDDPEYTDIQGLMQNLIRRYCEEKSLREVRVAFMAFTSASRQRAQTTTLLPFNFEKSETAVGKDYFIHPDPQRIFDYVVPQSVRTNFFRVFLEACASEHVQRMIAMNSATENAANMIKDLTQMYNRARQAQITREISEIMGAVRALKKD